MRKLKILYLNRPKSAFIGGDYEQMIRTADELGKLGCEIDILDQPIIPPLAVRQYDLIHCWNMAMKWSPYATIWADIHMKPLVYSPIYAQTEEYVPYKHQQVIANRTDAFILLNSGELRRMKDNLEIDEDKVNYVPNGIDKSWFKKQRVKANEPFVLTVGRLEPFKGQLMVAKVCKDLGMKYICVGERYSEEYAKEVEANGGICIGVKDQKELMKLYATCSVLCLASRAELMSLSIMEGLAQNCNVVLTDHSEWIPKGSTLCEYDNYESIKHAIEIELKKPKTDKTELVKYLTWENVAKDVLKIYEKTVIDFKKPKPIKYES